MCELKPEYIKVQKYEADRIASYRLKFDIDRMPGQQTFAFFFNWNCIECKVQNQIK